jgi:surface protein
MPGFSMSSFTFGDLAFAGTRNTGVGPPPPAGPLILKFDSSLDDDDTVALRLGTADVVVDWGDGNVEPFNVGPEYVAYHTYASTDIYTVMVTGTISDATTDPYNYDYMDALIECVSFGDLGYTNLNYFFAFARRLTSVPASLPASVTSTQGMFFRTDDFLGGGLETWDVSNVTDMSYMFYEPAYYFDADLSEWDVSSVTDMSYMFYYAFSFAGDISGWDVSNVTDMSYMFLGNQVSHDLSTWNVSSVNFMDGMFASSQFNTDIGGWDVSNVQSMNSMFSGALFNQDIGGWDVSNLLDASGMFFFGALSNANYDALLVGWSAQSVQSDVPFDAGSAQYSGTGAPGRAILAGSPNFWDITDGGSV